MPNVPPLFWSFRIMVGLGFCFIALFAVAFCARQRRASSTAIGGFLWLALLSLPLPWIAAELGWIVAEVRPPALGDRRRAADLPGGLQHLGGQCLVQR